MNLEMVGDFARLNVCCKIRTSCEWQMTNYVCSSNKRMKRKRINLTEKSDSDIKHTEQSAQGQEVEFHEIEIQFFMRSNS
jgi:hypothetical protein